MSELRFWEIKVNGVSTPTLHPLGWRWLVPGEVTEVMAELSEAILRLQEVERALSDARRGLAGDFPRERPDDA